MEQRNVEAHLSFQSKFRIVQTIFNNSKARRIRGHGSKPISEKEIVDEMSTLFLDLFAPGTVIPFPEADITQAWQAVVEKKEGAKNAVTHGAIPSVFGVRAHLEFGGPETGGMGCVRVGQEGYRTVVACHTAALKDYMTKLASTLLPNGITIQSMYDYVMGVTDEDFDIFPTLAMMMADARCGARTWGHMTS